MNPPKPTALKIISGTAERNKQRLNQDEPQTVALTEAPTPPLDLTGVALAAWQRLSKSAISLRVLTEADLDALALTCRALAEYEESSRDGSNWRRADAAWKRYMAGLGRFGLTPSDRTRVHAIRAKEKDPLAGLLQPKARQA